MSDHSAQDRELAHWKKWQAKVDAVWGWQTPAGKIRAARRAALFLEYGRMTAQSVVLEIGCGTGEFTEKIASQVKELWAIDLSPELLDRARERVASLSGADRIKFLVQDATATDLPGEKFDAVFGCSVLHHVEARAAVSEVFRLLKPGGWAVFSEPNMLNPQIALQKNIGWIKRKMGDSPDETAFFRWTLVQLLRQAGFEEVTVCNFDFLHPLTPQRWLRALDRIGLMLERLPLIRAISGSLFSCARKPLKIIPDEPRLEI